MEKEEKKEKTVYTLGLHESMEIKTDLGGKVEITRVPGGWVYCFEYPGFRQSPILFVPFDNEYQVITKIKTKKD
jgi:hypothetical protein